MDQNAIIVATLLLLSGLGIGYLWKKAPGDRSTAERLLGDPYFRTYSLTLIYLMVGIAASVYLMTLIISKQVTDPGVSALIGSAIGSILSATLLTPSGYHFGSSEGSRLKDDK